MKKFEPPTLVDITDLAEGVYASSGAIITPPTTPTPAPPSNNINYSLQFNDLDSGSYSVVRFIAYNIDTHLYSGIDVTIDFRQGECNSVLSEVYEVNGSDHAKNVYKQGTSAVIQIRMDKRNQGETVEVAFKTKFTHTYQNDLHPENSGYGSYDGYAEDGKMIPNRDINNYASVYITLINR